MQILQTDEHLAKWKEFFEPGETVLAHDKLWEQFLERQPFARIINKFFFYSANFDAFGMPTLKAENGSLGYQLTVKQPPIE